jgi:hypothetical protein
MKRYLLAFFLLLLPSTALRADERLAGIACRSVHLNYPAPAGAVFYNEVVIDESAPGTYFCVCGFSKGYYGLQELGNGKKVVIFSVWDPGEQNDPKAVDEDRRVKLLHQGEGVRIGRFGNEGTGGQSFYDLDWKKGETYRFLVAAKPAGERTEFAAWLYLNDAKKWQHLVTFSTITGGKPLSGYYSFVEDFRRNRESAKQARVARFGHGGVIDEEGKWHGFASARFTGDNNPATNIDSGERDGWYFLATGGETKNEGTKLNQATKLSGDAKAKPDDLPDLAHTDEKK